MSGPSSLPSRSWSDGNRSGTSGDVVATLLGLSSAASRCRQSLSRIDGSHPKLQDRLRDMLDRLPELESGRCSDKLLDEILGFARINDLRGSDVWPSGQIKDDVKNEFEGLRKKIKQIQEKLRWDERIDARVGPDQLASGTAGRSGAQSLRVDQARAQRPGF